MNRKAIILGLTLSLGAQHISANPFDFLAGLTNQNNAISYAKPETVMSPIRADIERRKALIKESVEIGTAKQGINAIFLHLDKLPQRSIDVALRWLQITGQHCKSLPLSPQVRQQLECVIILSMGVYLYERMQEAFFDLLKNLNQHTRYWEKQQESPLSHTIHRPISQWFSATPAQQNVQKNLMQLRKMHEENCAMLGAFATEAERFDSDEHSIEKKYEWLASVLITLYRNNQTTPHIAPTFESLENALINAGHQIKKYPETIDTQIALAKTPSHLGRNWLRYLGFGIGATAGLSYYLANKQWVHNKADAAFDTFIKTPFNNFWNTIFNFDEERDLPDLTDHRNKTAAGLEKALNAFGTLAEDIGDGVETTNQSIKDALSKMSSEGELSPEEREALHSPENQAALKQELIKRYETNTVKFAQYHNSLIGESLPANTAPININEVKQKAQKLDARFLSELLTTWSDDLSYAKGEEDLNGWPILNQIHKAMGKVENIDNWVRGYKKDELPFILKALDLFKDIGTYNLDQAVTVLQEDGKQGLDEIKESFDRAKDNFTQAKDEITEGMAGLSDGAQKYATQSRNMLNATRNVIAITAIAPAIAGTVFAGYKIWQCVKGMIYREPDYKGMRRALNEIAHILNSYDYQQLNQMMPEHYGLLLYNVHELKSQAMLLREPTRHLCLLDVERLASTNLTSEKKMNVINLMYRNYDFLNAKAA